MSHGDVAMEMNCRRGIRDAFRSHGDVAMEIAQLLFGCHLPECVPSMEPWRCSHGDSRAHHESLQEHTTFNGAMAM